MSRIGYVHSLGSNAGARHTSYTGALRAGMITLTVVGES